MAAWTPTSSVVRFASARSRSRSASAEARRWPRIPDSGIRCSIVTLTSAPPSMNGRWSSEGEIIGSSSAETMIGPRLSGARARARGLDLVSSLACEANHVRQTERRRERGRRLGRQPDRPERRRNREEKSESKTCGTCHVDHRMCHALRPDWRHVAGPNNQRRCLPGDAGKLLVHRRSRGGFLGRIPRQRDQTIAMHGRLGDTRASVGLRHRDVILGVRGVPLRQCQEVLLEGAVIGGCARLGRQRAELSAGGEAPAPPFKNEPPPPSAPSLPPALRDTPRAHGALRRTAGSVARGACNDRPPSLLPSAEWDFR